MTSFLAKHFTSTMLAVGFTTATYVVWRLDSVVTCGGPLANAVYDISLLHTLCLVFLALPPSAGHTLLDIMHNTTVLILQYIFIADSAPPPVMCLICAMYHICFVRDISSRFQWIGHCAVYTFPIAIIILRNVYHATQHIGMSVGIAAVEMTIITVTSGLVMHTNVMAARATLLRGLDETAQKTLIIMCMWVVCMAVFTNVAVYEAAARCQL